MRYRRSATGVGSAAHSGRSSTVCDVNHCFQCVSRFTWCTTSRRGPAGMPLASGLPRSLAARLGLVIPATLKALGHGRIPMKWYRISAAAAGAHRRSRVCSGDGGGGPSNASPVAKFSIQCTLLACTFTDASTDDGSIASRSWDFGEPSSGANNTSTAQNPASHLCGRRRLPCEAHGYR